MTFSLRRATCNMHASNGHMACTVTGHWMTECRTAYGIWPPGGFYIVHIFLLLLLFSPTRCTSYFAHSMHCHKLEVFPQKVPLAGEGGEGDNSDRHPLPNPTNPLQRSIKTWVSKWTCCLTSTETIRFIRDGEKGGGGEYKPIATRSPPKWLLH